MDEAECWALRRLLTIDGHAYRHYVAEESGKEMSDDQKQSLQVQAHMSAHRVDFNQRLVRVSEQLRALRSFLDGSKGKRIGEADFVRSTRTDYFVFEWSALNSNHDEYVDVNEAKTFEALFVSEFTDALAEHSHIGLEHR
jgi:hypothetical protein